MILTIFEILMISDPDAPLPRNTCRRRSTAAVAPAVAQTAFAVARGTRLRTTNERGGPRRRCSKQRSSVGGGEQLSPGAGVGGGKPGPGADVGGTSNGNDEAMSMRNHDIA